MVLSLKTECPILIKMKRNNIWSKSGFKGKKKRSIRVNFAVSSTEVRGGEGSDLFGCVVWSRIHHCRGYYFTGMCTEFLNGKNVRKQNDAAVIRCQ